MMENKEKLVDELEQCIVVEGKSKEDCLQEIKWKHNLSDEHVAVLNAEVIKDEEE